MTRRRGGNVQRKDEVLAAYALSPLGERIGAFVKRIGLPRGTWSFWMTEDPDFREKVGHLRAERARVCLEPLEEHGPALFQEAVRQAMRGSAAHLRIIAECLGLTRPPGTTAVRVNNQVVQSVTAVGAVPTEEELLAMVAERRRLLGVVQRAAELTVPELPAPPEENDAGDG